MANYFMPGEVAGIPTTTDPFNPFEKLMSSPMFNMGMGILANNTGHYGQLGPALGRGVQQGMQNIEANKQRQTLNEYNRKQQELLSYKYDTDRLKATMKRKQAEAEGQGAANFFKAAFPGYDFSYQAFDDDYQLVPVSTSGGKPTFGDIDPKVSGFLGLSPEDMQGIALIGQSDPKTAMRMMETAYKQRLRGTGAGGAARDALAKERAMFEAIQQGGPFADYLTEKNRKQPLVDMRGMQFGTSFTPAVDETGKPVLLQPAKGGGRPNVVEGFTPADDASKYRKEAESKGKRLASLDALDTDITETLNMPGLKYAVGMYSVAPTVPGTAQADAVAKIEQLASKAAVSAINEMRELSATGGAVGQVTEAEWPKLEAQLANLNRKQSYESFTRELSKFQRLTREAKARIKKAMESVPNVGNTPKQPNVDDLLKKYGGK